MKFRPAPNLIIFGNEGAGKSSLGQALADIAGYTPTAITSALRQELSQKYPHINFWQNRTPPGVMEMMSAYEGKYGRYYWCEKWINNHNSHSNFWLIDDGRFQEDLDFFSELGFKSLYLSSVQTGGEYETLHSVGTQCDYEIQAKSLPVIELAKKVMEWLWQCDSLKSEMQPQ